MKNNYRRLGVILGLFPKNAFYTCTVDDYGVKCQGTLDSNTIILANKLKFAGTIYYEKGWNLFNRGNIEITLT